MSQLRIWRRIRSASKEMFVCLVGLQGEKTANFEFSCAVPIFYFYFENEAFFYRELCCSYFISGYYVCRSVKGSLIKSSILSNQSAWTCTKLYINWVSGNLKYSLYVYYFRERKRCNIRKDKLHVEKVDCQISSTIPGIAVQNTRMQNSLPPTEHFTDSEPRNPGISVSEQPKVRGSPDLRAQKLWHVRSGKSLLSFQSTICAMF